MPMISSTHVCAPLFKSSVAEARLFSRTGSEGSPSLPVGRESMEEVLALVVTALPVCLRDFKLPVAEHASG